MRKFFVHLLNGSEVHRSIFTNCSVGTTSGFNSHNSLPRQCFRPGENQLVLFRINVISNNVNVVSVAEALAGGGPMNGGAMSGSTLNGSVMHSHTQYMK